MRLTRKNHNFFLQVCEKYETVFGFARNFEIILHFCLKKAKQFSHFVKSFDILAEKIWYACRRYQLKLFNLQKFSRVILHTCRNLHKLARKCLGWKKIEFDEIFITMKE